MDTNKDSASMRNPLRLDSDAEKSTKCRATAKQRAINDNAENVFTSASHATDSNSASQNGPLLRHLNSSANDLNPQSSRSSDNSVECNKNVSGNNRTSNRNDSFADISEASSSKADPGVCDGDAQTRQRYRLCVDKAGNVNNAPSTSGSIRDTENVNCRESRKRPSTLKLTKSNLDADESSSDTGNDDYSLGSEDGCIYTYRGGQHLADLPSSFFSLDMGLPLDRHLPTPPNYQAPQGAGGREGSRASSPDMDFLEMDFDPGPSCEVDTGDESTPDAELEAASNMPEENEPVIRGTSPEYMPGPSSVQPVVPVASSSRDAEESYNVPSTSQGLVSAQGDVGEEARKPINYGPFITHVNAKGEKLVVRRTMSHWPANAPVNLHVSSGDLVSPREMLNYDEQHPEGPFAYQVNQGEGSAFDAVNMSSTVYHLNMAKKLMGEKPDTENNKGHDTKAAQMVFEPHPEAAGSSTTDARCVEPPRSMIWSEREACERQVTQIGTSACGATAVVNVFIALGVPVNVEQISSAVGTRQRANAAPIPRYLMSRAVAGCTAADLVAGIQKASDGLVTARFFPTHPERAVSLSHWLADWIALGAVPILTLNLQVGCEGEIPDAWHHQMVFGVSPRGIYLCNPVECVRESILWPRLTSPSVLLVRTRDVLARFSPEMDLTPLMIVPERRFHTFNVLGQVVNVIREWRAAAWSEQGTRTTHIRIPAAYQAGVTVAALTGSEAHRRLMHMPQLPIVNPQTDPA